MSRIEAGLVYLALACLNVALAFPDSGKLKVWWLFAAIAWAGAGVLSLRTAWLKERRR